MLPTSQTSSGSRMAPGIIFPWISNTVDPKDALECNGSTFSATEYPKLYAILGTTNLPDIRDRVLWGSDTANQIIEAGLPNITGNLLTCLHSSGYYSGSFYLNGTGPRTGNDSSDDFEPTRYVNFKASLSNSIYGASATVQPPAYTVRWFIQAK